MSTRSCQGTDSVIKPLDTIPEDKKVRVQRTQSGFDPFEKPASQVKRVHSENNACINAKSSTAGKESPKLRRHSSPSSVSAPLQQHRKQHSIVSKNQMHNFKFFTPLNIKNFWTLALMRGWVYVAVCTPFSYFDSRRIITCSKWW